MDQIVRYRNREKLNPIVDNSVDISSSLYAINMIQNVFESSLHGGWGTKQGALTKAFKKAIKNAIESNRKILYPSTFALFKKLFSSFL